MSDDKRVQLEIYGQALTGQETSQDKEKLLRVNYLKGKLRHQLDVAGLGDAKDISTDIAKSIALGMAIYLGLVKDTKIIDRYKALVTAQVALYGSPEVILGALEAQAGRLAGPLGKYYEAKVLLTGCKDEEETRMIDIES